MQYNLLDSKESNGKLLSEFEAKKCLKKQLRQSFSYGKQTYKRRRNNTDKMLFSKLWFIDKLEKLLNARLIKEDFCEKAGQVYTGMQQGIKQLVKNKKKELNKKGSGVLNRVVVRDNKLTKTFDSWLKIYKYYDSKFYVKSKNCI